MKKAYSGLMAEKVDFGKYDLATTSSLPPGCIQLVADEVVPGGNVCRNPKDTTQYMYLFSDPFGNTNVDLDCF